MGVLDGKVAIVTGASRGIGAEIARRFGAAGAAVVVTARTMHEGASPLAGTVPETVDQITADGGMAIAIGADLSRPEDRERLVATATGQLGPIDILVNNAAVTYFEPVAGFSAKRMALMFAVQVEAPFHLSQLVLPSMRERRTGWILNISSRAAIHPVVGTRRRGGGTVYGMCKAALERFTTGLAAEVYEDGVAVNVLSPNRVVPTAGTVYHGLTTVDNPEAEPASVMAEAALALCTGLPVLADGQPGLTGRVAYSQDLLGELADHHEPNAVSPRIVANGQTIAGL